MAGRASGSCRAADPCAARRWRRRRRRRSRGSRTDAERRAVEVATRLDPPVGQDHRVVDRRRQFALGDGGRVSRACREPPRAPAACSEASRRPARVGRVAVAGDDRRAGQQPTEIRRADAPGRVADGARAGRRRRHGPSRARPRPSCAAATSATCRRRRGHRRARHEHAEHPVGPVDEREPLLGVQRQRREAGGRERVGGVDAALRRSQTSPSPISASATWASGARSPLAPSDPCSRTTGVMPALSMASSASATSGEGQSSPSRQRCDAQQRPSPGRPRARRRRPCRRRASE